jgi:ribokinase
MRGLPEVPVTRPIAVVGSLNMDLVVRVDVLPERGQTVSGRGFATLPGGKGANQACAAARLGGRCRMIGRVGADAFGDRLKAGLAADGVDTSHVLVTDGEATGVALIPVEDGGQNVIVVAGGANLRLRPEDAEGGLRDVAGGLLLLQLESPAETVEAAAGHGRALSMTVVLDPAPARPLAASLLQRVDVLTPNETEALALLGRRGNALSVPEARDAGRMLRALGPATVIVKLGAKGVVVVDEAGFRHWPAPSVEAVDATAAGDTFNGALAVALSEGRPLDEAARFAVTAASISVMRVGAQVSIPTRAQVDAFVTQ